MRTSWSASPVADHRVVPAARARGINLRVDRVTVRARELRADDARELGRALADALPSALAGAAQRVGGAAPAGFIDLTTLRLRLPTAVRTPDLPTAAGPA